MAKNQSQPPYTPEQARARARAGPKTSTSAGRAGRTIYGKGRGEKLMFKPGVRTGATGPESGRNRGRQD
jgi:hypothetical protein